MAKRVDDHGRAYKGSQLQVQIYVNRHKPRLDQAIRDALPRVGELDWRAPLEKEGFREPQDSAFLRAIDRQALKERLRDFWPRGGPVWDGLAITASGGVVLVEGKSYPGEFRSAMEAKDPDSRAKILKSLAWTYKRLGLGGDATEWATRYYQSANRLAHLIWLREAGVHAWLVNLLFVDDTTQAEKATSREQWERELPRIKAELGDVRTPWAAYVYLRARERGELLT